VTEARIRRKRSDRKSVHRRVFSGYRKPNVTLTFIRLRSVPGLEEPISSRIILYGPLAQYISRRRCFDLAAFRDASQSEAPRTTDSRDSDLHRTMRASRFRQSRERRREAGSATGDKFESAAEFITLKRRRAKFTARRERSTKFRWKIVAGDFRMTLGEREFRDVAPGLAETTSARLISDIPLTTSVYEPAGRTKESFESVLYANRTARVSRTQIGQITLHSCVTLLRASTARHFRDLIIYQIGSNEISVGGCDIGYQSRARSSASSLTASSRNCSGPFTLCIIFIRVTRMNVPRDNTLSSRRG